MALYKLTYMNGGKDTSIRDINFDNDVKANNFADLYNSMNENSKVIRINKLISEMSEKKKDLFLSKNFNCKEVLDLKIMYRTNKNEVFNLTLAYLDRELSENDLKNLMYYVRDFKEIIDVQYKTSKFF